MARRGLQGHAAVCSGLSARASSESLSLSAMVVEPSSSTNTPRRVSSLRRAGDDLVQHRLKRFFGRRGGQGTEALAWSRRKRSSGPFLSGTTFDERRRAVGAAPVHAVQRQAVKVDVEVGGRAKALDQCDRAAVSLLGHETRLPEQVAGGG